MSNSKMPLYIFGWPSFLGGADTKLAHLLPIICNYFAITVIPNESRFLHDKYWTGFLNRLGIAHCTFEGLPTKLQGIGLAMCNECFFAQHIAHRARDRGLKIIWSSEMMWHHPGEKEAVAAGVIDKVLYTSEFQKSVLSPGYGSVPGALVGNYIDPAQFPFKERANETFTIGRLSRAEKEKYPEDFPAFYERLQLPEVRFRVMAWDELLTEKYKWFHFDDRWDLLPAQKESQLQFLHSLDLFVYPLGHKVRESWGRSTVEAMLTGCIPLVPSGHHLENLLVPGEAGFVCQDFLEWKECAQKLYHDVGFRRTMARRCHDHAVTNLCNREEHLRLWIDALA